MSPSYRLSLSQLTALLMITMTLIKNLQDKVPLTLRALLPVELLLLALPFALRLTLIMADVSLPLVLLTLQLRHLLLHRPRSRYNTLLRSARLELPLLRVIIRVDGACLVNRHATSNWTQLHRLLFPLLLLLLIRLLLLNPARHQFARLPLNVRRK